jgi:hypothetical protein
VIVRCRRGSGRHRSALSAAVLTCFLLGAFPAWAQEGGSVTIGSAGADSLDPQLFQAVQALEPLWFVYTPLLTYPRAEISKGHMLPLCAISSSVP